MKSKGKKEIRKCRLQSKKYRKFNGVTGFVTTANLMEIVAIDILVLRKAEITVLASIYYYARKVIQRLFKSRNTKIL